MITVPTSENHTHFIVHMKVFQAMITSNARKNKRLEKKCDI